MKITESEHWIKFCDELILASSDDEELKDGLAWLDKKSQKDNISFYDILWNVLMLDPINRFDDEMGDFMQSITRRYK
jgi:hypothetical protein